MTRNRMTVPENYTFQDCLNLALSCDDYRDWKVKHSASYGKASKKQWLPAIKAKWLENERDEFTKFRGFLVDNIV